MGRIALVVSSVAVVVVLVAAPGRAGAAPCTTCDAEVPFPVSSGPPRAVFIKWATSVNTVFTAFDVQQQLRVGKRNNLVTGLQFVAAVPVTLYGLDYVGADHHDWVALGLTVWSAALLAHGFWPVIESKLHGAGVDVPSPKVKIAPATLVGWDDQQARAGVSLGFAF
jgi:hypothetical protein